MTALAHLALAAARDTAARPWPIFNPPLTFDQFTRLADDGCPNCPEHVVAVQVGRWAWWIDADLAALREESLT